MKVVKKKLTLSKGPYLRRHLQVVTSVQPVSVTRREIDILTEMLLANVHTDGLSSAKRKDIKTKLDISDSNLSNFVKRLVEKGLVTLRLEGTKKVYGVHPVLIPSPDSQKYEFELVNEDI